MPIGIYRDRGTTSSESVLSKNAFIDFFYYSIILHFVSRTSQPTPRNPHLVFQPRNPCLVFQPRNINLASRISQPASRTSQPVPRNILATRNLLLSTSFYFLPSTFYELLLFTKKVRHKSIDFECNPIVLVLKIGK